MLNYWFWSLLVYGLVSFSASNPIILRDENLSFTPKEYFIANVVDQRAERRSVAQLITTPGRSAEVVDLPGGAANAIKQFTQVNLRQNTKLRPVTIRLSDLKLTETAVGTNRVDGN